MPAFLGSKFVLLRVASLLCAYVVFANVGISTAMSQDAPAHTSAAGTGAAESEAEGEMVEQEQKAQPKLDLGRFNIKDLRPTRNETAKVTFAIHLAFAEDITENQVEQLEMWKHRLRDQVITAVRVSYIKDFQEPDLALFRRKILIRVNRLFKRKIATEVLLTEYKFRTS